MLCTRILRASHALLDIRLPDFATKQGVYKVGFIKSFVHLDTGAFTAIITTNTGVTASVSPGQSFSFIWGGNKWNKYTSSSGAGGGTGTVTSVAVVAANGFTGSVSTPSTTPAITLQTSVAAGRVLKAAAGGAIAACTGADVFPGECDALTLGVSAC